MATRRRRRAPGRACGNGRGFPWLTTEVRPTAGFDDVRPLFEDELRLLDVIDDVPGLREAAYRRIRETAHLRAPDGRPVPEFLLHIQGEASWWRWSDEPFREPDDEP